MKEMPNLQNFKSVILEKFTHQHTRDHNNRYHADSSKSIACKLPKKYIKREIRTKNNLACELGGKLFWLDVSFARFKESMRGENFPCGSFENLLIDPRKVLN